MGPLSKFGYLNEGERMMQGGRGYLMALLLF